MDFLIKLLSIPIIAIIGWYGWAFNFVIMEFTQSLINKHFTFKEYDLSKGDYVGNLKKDGTLHTFMQWLPNILYWILVIRLATYLDSYFYWIRF